PLPPAPGPGALQLGDGVRGRHVLVTGAGVVGLLVALLARHHGAGEVLVADATPPRLAAAPALRLEAAAAADGTAWLAVKERWRRDPTDCGADVVFQCRGRTAALAAALRSLRPQGTVVDLAFYQGGAADLALGEEFHHNGLTIRCAQIGRVPRGMAHLWDRRRLAAETGDLLRAPGPGRRPPRPAGRPGRPPSPRPPGGVRLPGGGDLDETGGIEMEIAGEWVVVGIDNGGTSNNATILDPMKGFLVDRLVETPSL